MGLAGVAAAGIGLSAVSSVVGGIGGSNAASSAASQQQQAANQATALQQQQFAQTTANLAPYLAAGTTALPEVQSLVGANAGGDPGTSWLTQFNPTTASVKPTTLTPTNPVTWDPTEAGLEATPGYQFSLSQGEKGVQNSFAAKGLASSGAALKGAADYAQGLASNTYQTQFSNYSTLFGQQQTSFQNEFSNYLNQNTQDYAHQQQVYNMLSGLSGSGQNAAAGLGALGAQSTNAQSQLITSGGAAGAAGTVGSQNAINSGLSGAAGSLSSGAQLYSLINSGLLGGQGTNVGGISGNTYNNNELSNAFSGPGTIYGVS